MGTNAIINVIDSEDKAKPVDRGGRRPGSKNFRANTFSEICEKYAPDLPKSVLWSVANAYLQFVKRAEKRYHAGNYKAENFKGLRVKKFITEFLKTGSAAEAGAAVGYDKSTTYRLMHNPEVRKMIDEELEKMRCADIADKVEVMKYLTSVMRGEITEMVPVLVGNGEQELKEKTVGAKERNKAAELIGKRYGMFVEKVDLTSNGQTLRPVIYLPNNGKEKAITALVASENVKEITADAVCDVVNYKDDGDIASPQEVLESFAEDVPCEDESGQE